MTFVVSIAGRTESGDEFHFLWDYEIEKQEKGVLEDLCKQMRHEVDGMLQYEYGNQEIERMISDDPENALNEALIQYHVLSKEVG